MDFVSRHVAWRRWHGERSAVRPSLLHARAQLRGSVRSGVCSELCGPGRLCSELRRSRGLCASVRRSRGLRSDLRCSGWMRSGRLCADLCRSGCLCSRLWQQLQ